VVARLAQPSLRIDNNSLVTPDRYQVRAARQGVEPSPQGELVLVFDGDLEAFRLVPGGRPADESRVIHLPGVHVEVGIEPGGVVVGTPPSTPKAVRLAGEEFTQ
jgi:hypothetical protein